MSGAALAGLVLGSVFAAVVLAALAWSDYRDAQAAQLLRRTADQHHRTRGGQR